MSIPIIDPLLPSGPAPDPDAPPVTPSSPSLISDTISAANDLPEIDLLTYAQTVGKGRTDLQSTENARILFNANNRNDFYGAYAIESVDFAQKLTFLMNLNAQYFALYNQNKTDVDAFNASVSAYNTNVLPADIAARAAINAAIVAYNGGGSVAAYNVAVGNWNAYVTSRNGNANYTNFSNGIATLNTSISNTNTELIDINAGLAEFNVPPVPDQTQYTGPNNSLSTLPLSPPTPVALVANIAPIAPLGITMTSPGVFNTLITINILAVIKALAASQLLTIKILLSQSDYQGFLQFQLQGSVTTVPDSVITPEPVANASTSTATGSTSGSGVAISTIVSNLSNPLTTAIVEQALYESYLASTINAQPAQLPQQFDALNLLLLSTIGLSAGSSLPGLLSGVATTSDLQSSAIALAVGSAIASEIAYVAQNNVVGDSVLNILRNAFPSVSPNSLDSLATQVSTATELVLLLLGLVQLGQVLNNPELAGQVVATLNAEDSLGATAATSTPALVLSNNARVDDLKTALTSSLAVQANISQNEAADIVDDSVNTALLNRDAINSGNLSQEISNAFINNGVSVDNANALADLAQSYIDAEISSGDILDESISNTNLNQAVLSNSYAQSLLQNEQITTLRQFRDAFAAELATSPDNTPSQAIEAANVVVTGQNPPVNVVSTDTLRSQLLSDATTQLSSLGETTASQIAQQIVNTVIGNGEIASDRASIASQINDRIETLVNSNDLQLTDTVKESLQNLLANTTDLWALGDWIRDPANTLLQVSGLNRTTEPTNFKANIDVRI